MPKLKNDHYNFGTLFFTTLFVITTMRSDKINNQKI